MPLDMPKPGFFFWHIYNNEKGLHYSSSNNRKKRQFSNQVQINTKVFDTHIDCLKLFHAQKH